MNRGFARLRRGMGTLMKRAKFMMIGLQLTATIMGVQMVRAALKYERSLRNVTSLMAGVGMGNAEIEKSFRSMDASIRSMAVRTGQMPNDLAQGMYNVVSATFDGASGLKVLEAAAVGAFAGLSDTATTTGLLTKTLQAYRQEGESNDKVASRSMDTMDAYFMAVNRGMFTFDDLANKMGALPSTAAAFGISLEDMLGFLSTATVRGVGLDEAITGVRQAMLQIGKLTPQTEKAAKQLFGADFKEKWGAEALAANGLYGTLMQLNEVLPDVPANIIEAAIAMEDEGGDAAGYLAEKLGENVGAIAQLFPNIRALKAVLAVTGPGLALYGENMDFMGERAGAAGRAQEEMAKSAEGSLQFLKAAWETFKIDVGNIALPFIKNIADSMVQWWGNMPMEFATEGGLFDDDMWAAGLPDSEIDGAAMKAAAERFWANAEPGEKVSFVLQSAWSDAITNLKNWFENGGGKEKLTGLGNTIGEGMANLLRGLAGMDSASIEGSIPYEFGHALLEGFTSAFEGFDWSGFFQSTFGTALATILGGLVAGPGGAAGGFAASQTGINPLVGIGGGYAAVKGGPALWRALMGTGAAGAAGAGGAAAGGGAAATGGGGLLATLGGGSALTGAGLAAGVAGIGYAGYKGWQLKGDISQMAGETGAQLYLRDILSEQSMSPAIQTASQGKLNDFYTARENASQMDQWTVYNPSEGAREQIMEEFGRTEEGILAALRMLPEDTAAQYIQYLAEGVTTMRSVTPSGQHRGGERMWLMGEGQQGPPGWAAGTGSVADPVADLISAGQTQDRAADTFNSATSRFSSAVSRMPTSTSSSGGAVTQPLERRNFGPYALGGRGTVYKPTTVTIGEAGPEDFDFTPRRNRGQGSGGGRTIYAPISITESGDPKATAAYVVRELEKAIGNG